MTTVWKPFRVGAGGLITGIDTVADGTLVCRADVFGAYIYDRTAANPGNAGGVGVWKQLVNTTSFASATSIINTPQSGDGVYEIRIAPGNSSVIYLVYSGCVFVSTDKGATFTQTAFSRLTSLVGQTGHAARTYQYKMAVDPANSDVVYIGTFTRALSTTVTSNVSGGATSVPVGSIAGLVAQDWITINNNTGNNGPFQVTSTDPNLLTIGLSKPLVGSISNGATCVSNAVLTTSGGRTGGAWNVVPGISGCDGSEIVCVAFDGSSGTTGGKTNVIYISVSGTGLYKSSNAGTSFSLVTSTPTTILNLRVAIDGTVFLTDNGQNLWRLSGTTWTNITPSALPGNMQVPVLDPTNANHVIGFSYGAGGCETTNAVSGSPPTWTTNNINFTMTATDAPYLAEFPNLNVTNGSLATIWDTLNNNKLWTSVNQGVWTIPVPLATGASPVAFTSVSAGIEELVTNRVLVPPGHNPICIVEDVGVVQKGSNPDKYALHRSWDTAVFLSWGSWADYASSNSDFVCAITNGETREGSGYSTDGGATWQQFAGYPAFGIRGGSIAAASPTNMVWVQSNEGDVYRTTDGGSTWTPCTFTGINNQAQPGTTLTSSALAGATSITVASVTNISIGSYVDPRSDGFRYLVTGISGTTLTLGSGLVVGYASGTSVYPHRTYTSNHASGTTSFDLTNVVGLTVGGGFGDPTGNVYAITGISGNTITIGAPGLLSSVSTGDEFIVKTGWGFAYFLNRCCVAADRVNIGTFYLQNGGSVGNGTWKSTDGGATWTRQTNTIDPGAQTILKSVPGNAGHLFCAGGVAGSGGGPATDWPHAYPFWRSTDGGASWVDVSTLSSGGFTVQEVWGYGFGKAAVGQTYPSIYLYGFVAVGASPLPSGSPPGLWKSDDQGVSWQQIGGQYPNGIPDNVRNVDGDPNIYGRVYVGYVGHGFEYGDSTHFFSPNSPGLNLRGQF